MLQHKFSWNKWKNRKSRQRNKLLKKKKQLEVIELKNTTINKNSLDGLNSKVKMREDGSREPQTATSFRKKKIDAQRSAGISTR